MSLKPLFSGEVLFRRWSDSSTQGVQVTFALADAAELEPLKGMAGRRFACVLVPINDDESLGVEQQQALAKPRPPDTRGPLCREACDYCALPSFQKYVAEVGGWPAGSVRDDEDCKEFILHTCGGISSRKELDTDQIAADLFLTRIRVPFLHWQRQQRRAA